MKITEERVRILKELIDKQLEYKVKSLGLSVVLFIYYILFIVYIIYLALQHIMKGV